ncbi:MAG TPA: hypothetical protein VME47_14140 [Acetobacteraceae bacterium]|nr:hypothetical protein [Acetobacteraceae bacterium]
MTKRQGNRPDRRIVPGNTLAAGELQRIAAAARYGGSALHKLHPGDYEFDPPVNPRPWKSVCDDKRVILKNEAAAMLAEGIRRGMVSQPRPGQLPKYVWAVDASGEVYEAKTTPNQDDLYHGYRLGDDEHQMRAEVLNEWNKR